MNAGVFKFELGLDLLLVTEVPPAYERPGDITCVSKYSLIDRENSDSHGFPSLPLSDPQGPIMNKANLIIERFSTIKFRNQEYAGAISRPSQRCEGWIASEFELRQTTAELPSGLAPHWRTLLIMPPHTSSYTSIFSPCILRPPPRAPQDEMHTTCIYLQPRVTSKSKSQVLKIHNSYFSIKCALELPNVLLPN